MTALFSQPIMLADGTCLAGPREVVAYIDAAGDPALGRLRNLMEVAELSDERPVVDWARSQARRQLAERGKLDLGGRAPPS
jgi:hypothetical protein